MKQKTVYQKPEIQQAITLTSGGFAQSVIMNANSYGTSASNKNEYTTSAGSWE